MATALLFVHLFVCIMLITLILLQSGKGGLGKAFGGDVVYRSKRGTERLIFSLTILTSVLFFFTSVVNYFI